MQKFRLMNMQHTFYARRDRTERDRPGGHCPSSIKDSFFGWKEHYGFVGRKFCKKVFSKQARRQQARITREALQIWYEN